MNTVVWVARIFGLIVVLVCLVMLMSLHGRLTKMSNSTTPPPASTPSSRP